MGKRIEQGHGTKAWDKLMERGNGTMGQEYATRVLDKGMGQGRDKGMGKGPGDGDMWQEYGYVHRTKAWEKGMGRGHGTRAWDKSMGEGN